MSSGRLAGVMRRLVDVALADGGGLSDGALLERYLNLREEAAFAALVRIHGPMVLGVCRRVLGNVHDADDAFQATFLVLVRKGQSIVPRERVGSWLHGVAYRTALKANAMAKRRRGKQVKLEDLADKDNQPEAEWLALLDQEINRLPEKYRAPLVLCDLESRTRKQAAKLLGCPEGTVATRLQHARGLIQKRLARHGLPAAAGATALTLGQAASAKVPYALLKATVKHATLFAAGTSAGAIPLKIIVLMEGVLNAMVLTKIKTATALLVLAGVLGVGGFAGKVYVAADDAPLPPPLTKGGAGGVVERAAATDSKKENDLPLPTGPAPAQAYVSLHESRLSVRMRSMGYRAMTERDAFGRPTTSYTPFETQIKKAVTRDDLKMVLEVQRSGQRILDSSEWPKAIKGETLALVVEDKGDFDLAHLRLIKEGTLVFVFAHKEFVVPPIPKVPTAGQLVPVQVVPALPSVPDVVEPLPVPPPLPAYVGPPPPLARPDNHSQFNAQTMQQANRDLAALKFYVKGGHAGSAGFYRDLIHKRYPDSLYSQQAEQLVRDMKQPAASEKGKVRVGQVIIVGNEHLPDAVIRQTLGFFPGAPLEFKDLRSAEERLNRLKDIGMHVAAKLIVLDPDKAAEYRDILVQVRELLDDTTRAEIGRLQGAWTVISTSLQGSDIHEPKDASFIFKGRELTAMTKNSKRRFSFLLNPSVQPKEIRFFPIDDTPEAQPEHGTYELKGDALVLRTRPDKDTAPATASTRMTELKLKRKQMPEGPPFGSFYPQAHSETFLSDPQTASSQRIATRIFFKTRVPSDNAAAYTNAEVFHMPADRLTAKMDRDHPGKDAFYLRCDSLKLLTREAASKNSEMIGEGNVFFREQSFFGTAAVVKYNETDDQLIFEGTPDQPAILHKKQPGHTEDQEIKGRQIMYNRKTGTLQVAGGITIAN